MLHPFRHAIIPLFFRSSTLFAILTALFFASLSLPSGAQQKAATAVELHNHLVNEISGRRIYATLTHLQNKQQQQGTLYHQRAFTNLRKHISEAGLSKIHKGERQSPTPDWTPLQAEIWLLYPQTRKIFSLSDYPFAIAEQSRTASGMVELIDIGAGENDLDYLGKQVKGKIVLASGSPDLVFELALLKRKAMGILIFPDTPQPGGNLQRELTLPRKAATMRKGPFAVQLTHEQGTLLRRQLSSGRNSTVLAAQSKEHNASSPLLRVDIKTRIRKSGKFFALHAEIPGNEIKDEIIWLTATLPQDQSQGAATSGTALLLEIARSLTGLIQDEILPAPRRTIRFCWASSEDYFQQYFLANQEMKDSLLVSIHLGRQGRHTTSPATLTSLPPTQPSFIFNLIENIIKQGNDAQKVSSAEWSNGSVGTSNNQWQPLSNLNSHPYSFQPATIPFDLWAPNSFLSLPTISIPTVSLSPEQRVPTSQSTDISEQSLHLKWNAYVVASAAWKLATLRVEDIPELASMVYASNRKRNADALYSAFSLLNRVSEKQSSPAAFKAAKILLDESIKIEDRRAQSLRLLIERPQALEILDDFASDMRRDGKDLNNRLRSHFSRIMEQRTPRISYISKEKYADRLIPQNTSDFSQYLQTRKRLSDKMHHHLQEMVLNAVDGQMSVLDIFHFIRSQYIRTQKGWEEIELEEIQAIIERGQQLGLLYY